MDSCFRDISASESAFLSQDEPEFVSLVVSSVRRTQGIVLSQEGPPGEVGWGAVGDEVSRQGPVPVGDVSNREDASP
jgi:hypothetical protein